MERINTLVLTVLLSMAVFCASDDTHVIFDGLNFYWNISGSFKATFGNTEPEENRTLILETHHSVADESQNFLFN